MRARLAATEIRVIRRPARRTHASRERYSAARMLASLAESDLVVFPLTLEFREGPDVALHMPNISVGIECTDAIAQEWAEILDLRAREYPEAITFPPRLKPGERSLSQEDIRAYASGTKKGPPWEGDAVEHDWAQAISHFAGKKLEMLRAGAYPEYADNWLLIHDEWALRPAAVEEQRLAASLLAKSCDSLFLAPCFSRVLIEGSKWLTCLTKTSLKVVPVVDLWN